MDSGCLGGESPQPITTSTPVSVHVHVNVCATFVIISAVYVLHNNNSQYHDIVCTYRCATHPH